MTKQIPRSLAGDPHKFAQAVQAHIEACTAHMLGKPGKPAPRASNVVESVVMRRVQTGPVATRGPDQFVAVPYEVMDDTPKTPEQQKAIETLRATIK